MVVLMMDGASDMGAALNDRETENGNHTYLEHGDQSGWLSAAVFNADTSLLMA
jgi:hypothetical protein